MQKLRVLTVLLFVSITMTLGSCAEDESLNEIENNLETTYDGDGDDDDNNTGGMSTTNGDDDDNNTGGM